MDVGSHPEESNVTDAEEGELEDSGNENEPETMKTENIKTEDVQTASPPIQQANDVEPKENIPSKMEFDESRPEEEQLDYGEDELEEKIKSEAPVPATAAANEKSEGEAESDSEGEIKSDTGDDFEEGETRDHPMDLPPEQKKVCKFFEMGNCTWGERCRYLHPGVNDKGNYDMFSDEPPKQAGNRRHPAFAPPHHRRPDPFWPEPPPFIPPPVAETAWEKGLRHAKEMKKRAMQRKVQEPDFMQKREVISTIVALNEDRDMEFVNNKPLANKGYDPFKEKEGDEYATPTPEEVRRHLMRERRHPPPSHRHLMEKDHRLPPPERMMHPEARRDRRPPSPRHDRYPADMRVISPRRDNDRDRRGNFPPNDPGFPPHFDDRRERRDFPDRLDITRGPYHPDAIRREPAIDRVKEDRYSSDGSRGSKPLPNGAPPPGQGQAWNDPWARGRPQTKGRNKEKPDSSSSSGSSSDSSSRSSSRSSDSSRSSRSSGSSSSGSSRSSSFSSDRDSSHSPSPSKNTTKKKKVLATVKQRNGAPGLPKKNIPPARLPPNVKPISQPKPEESIPPSIPVKKPVPDKKAPPQNQNVTNVPAARKPPKKPPTKKRTSSSSSEFSHSSDSSPSPLRAKRKSKSGSDSGSESSSDSSSSSMSSSSASSSSDSEGDKPANRRKRKPLKSTPGVPQVPPNVQGHSALPQHQSAQHKGKVMVPSKPGRKDVKMTILDKSGGPKKRTASEMSGQGKKPSSRRTELLEQLKAVEDAIARKRAKLT